MINTKISARDRNITQEFSGYDLINAYESWVADYVKKGWNPYLVSFMFKSINGSERAIKVKMEDEIDRVYSTFITHVVRNPNSESASDKRPILIAVPDLPVYKREKKTPLCLSTINNGLHSHGILLIPPKSRLRVGPEDHFEAERHRYIRGSLLKIDVRRIDTNVEYTTGYGLKYLKRGPTTFDDVVIFPKAQSEVRYSGRPSETRTCR